MARTRLKAGRDLSPLHGGSARDRSPANERGFDNKLGRHAALSKIRSSNSNLASYGGHSLKNRQSSGFL